MFTLSHESHAEDVATRRVTACYNALVDIASRDHLSALLYLVSEVCDCPYIGSVL